MGVSVHLSLFQWMWACPSLSFKILPSAGLLPSTLPLPPLLDDSLAWFLVRPREVQTQLQAHMPTDVYSADIY